MQTNLQPHSSTRHFYSNPIAARVYEAELAAVALSQTPVRTTWRPMNASSLPGVVEFYEPSGKSYVAVKHGSVWIVEVKLGEVHFLQCTFVIDGEVTPYKILQAIAAFPSSNYGFENKLAA